MAGRIKSNRDMFALKGNPWEGSLPERRPVLGPDGKLHLNRRAHIHELLNPSHSQDSDVSIVESCSEDAEMDQFLADHCLPISIRLRKERNKLLPSMTSEIESRNGKPSAVSDNQRLRIASRLKLNKMKASHLVKVKS